jgi:hypothetical protein
MLYQIYLPLKQFLMLWIPRTAQSLVYVASQLERAGWE